MVWKRPDYESEDDDEDEKLAARFARMVPMAFNELHPDHQDGIINRQIIVRPKPVIVRFADLIEIKGP